MMVGCGVGGAGVGGRDRGRSHSQAGVDREGGRGTSKSAAEKAASVLPGGVSPDLSAVLVHQAAETRAARASSNTSDRSLSERMSQVATHTLWHLLRLALMKVPFQLGSSVVMAGLSCSR